MRIINRPKHQIWIKGAPKSGQSKGAKTYYIKSIQKAARNEIEEPNQSRRIGIEIWFQSDTGARADVDNVLKPILDALKGIAYLDDRQVIWVKAVAIPTDFSIAIAGPMRTVDFELLQENFLINIFEGEIPGGISSA